MGKSVVLVDEAMLAKFLLVMPEGTTVTGAESNDRIYPRLELSIEGDPVPDAMEVNAIINTREECGNISRWMTFEPRENALFERASRTMAAVVRMT